MTNWDDYYPFGSIAQSGTTGSTYRYDYQGLYAQKDNYTNWNDFELRMYDGKVGRWLSMDPAGQFNSPYEAMGNNPVTAIDPTGGCDPGDPNCGCPVPQPVKDPIYLNPDLPEVTIHYTRTFFDYPDNKNEFEEQDVDKHAVELMSGILMFTGVGEVEDAGYGTFKLFNFAWKNMATKAVLSIGSQAYANGIRNIDLADVIFDSTTNPLVTPYLDAAVDLQPFSTPGTPTLSIVGYNKDVGRATYEAAANLIMGKIPEVKNFGLQYAQPFVMTDLTVKFENYIFGK